MSETSQRLDGLITRPELDSTEITWFTGPNGLLEYCASHDVTALDALADDPGFERLLQHLDDRTVAFPGARPSDRARALINVALSVRGGRALDDDSVDALLPSGLGDERIALGELIVGDLAAHFQGQAPPEESITTPVPTSRHSYGDVALLSVRRAAVGVAPDLVAAPFQRLDSAFIGAMRRAALAGGVSGGVRFHLASRQTLVPIDAAQGDSVGLAAGYLLSRVRQPKLPAAPLDWVMTGGIDETGRIATLVSAAGTHGYRQKLEALAPGSHIVCPEPDLPTVERLAGEVGGGLIAHGVTHLDDVAPLLSRLAEAQIAFQRTLDGRRDRHRFRLFAGLGAAAVLLIAVIAGVWAARDSSTGEGESSPLIGALLLAVDTPPGSVLMSFETLATEVSNEQYAQCVSAGACEATVREQIAPTGVSQNGRYPVTGISAAQAEQFCEWAFPGRGRLPTLAEWRYLLDNVVTNEFPKRPGDTTATVSEGLQALPVRAQRVDDPLTAQPGQPAWIVGNVAEWTRTKCDETGNCVDLPAVRQTTALFLRVTGVSFDMLQELDPSDETWLQLDAPPYLIRVPDEGYRDIGFRCSMERTI